MEKIAYKNFHKDLINDVGAIIIYFVKVATSAIEPEEWVIAYANQEANRFFGTATQTIENKKIKDTPKLANFGDLLHQIELLQKSQNQSVFRVDYGSGIDRVTYRSHLKFVKEGILLTISSTVINTYAKGTLSHKESLLKARITELELSNLFSNRVLNSINTIITYLKPLFNKDRELVDFTIAYINKWMDVITNEEPSSIIGKKLLDYYPQNNENGVMDILRECYKTGENNDYVRKFIFNKKAFWLSNRVVKMNDGLILFSKDITQEKKYEEQLFFQNNLLLEAELVAGIGSFKWNFIKKEIHFSDNVYRLFGHEPNSFKADYKRLLSFVHPRDAVRVRKSFSFSKSKKTKLDIVFRINTKSNTIKHINIIGKCYHKDHLWFMVGVIKDVTGQLEAASSLKSKNAELKRTNSDLEAFNRVASHDLQEPLRKIQMFISRLNEEEKDRLGTKSLQYLDKIKSSSDRMRNLIVNLLSYSKMDEEGELPKKVNLNEVLNFVQEELAERITELKAEIKSDKLPVVNGIQFQLEQLFINLIGNSLKYRKEGISAKIQIKADIISSAELPLELLSANTNFVKLQFIDNGIGFEPQYEDKIFEIFQRLHGKTEYSGTGLGLSICKKIVQAHNGDISAKGIAGVGAVFTVYLPTLQ